MSFKGSTDVPRAFAAGISKKQGVNLSTGTHLFYHGNLIAEWRKDGLYISNGGYVTYSRNGTEIPGSKTTKDKLNALPGVSVHQSACKWYLNGKEWNGEWVKVKGVKAPKEFNTKAIQNAIIETNGYQSFDGWRGGEFPIYACAAANNTGGWSDSPCREDVCISELAALETELLKHGIKTRRVWRQTSNVFCVRGFLIPQLKNVARAREIVKQYLENNQTQLAYIVNAA